MISKQYTKIYIIQILRPYLNLLKIVLEYRCFIIELDLSQSKTITKQIIKTNNDTTNTKNTKIKIIKELKGNIINKNIKIISVNIAGKLEEKVKQIKKILHTEHPDFLCLQETHTYTESFKFIQ